jgi:hypothetical protein
VVRVELGASGFGILEITPGQHVHVRKPGFRGEVAQGLDGLFRRGHSGT